MAESSFVYLVRSRETGLFKIGKSDDPDYRLECLQRMTYQGLTLVHRINTNDSFWLESKFHRFFKDRRVQGEWFSLSQDELASILVIQQRDRIVIGGRCFDDHNQPPDPLPDAMAYWGQIGGKKGGRARAAALSPERRSEIARMGGLAKKAKRGQSFPPPEPTP